MEFETTLVVWGRTGTIDSERVVLSSGGPGVFIMPSSIFQAF
jgi:hypothetical protein